MKHVLAIFLAVALLGAGAIVFAHGYGGYGGGHMMGYGGGYGSGSMMGGGYGGGPMMGYSGNSGYDAETKAFLDKTVDLRKDLHEKHFAYGEALRNGDEKKAEKIGKEIDTLLEKLNKEAPRSVARGYNCW